MFMLSYVISIVEFTEKQTLFSQIAPDYDYEVLKGYLIPGQK